MVLVPLRVLIVDDNPGFRQMLDVRLGADDGFEVAREVARARPGTAVLLMSCDDHRDAVDAVRRAGARGFVLKSELLRANLSDYWA